MRLGARDQNTPDACAALGFAEHGSLQASCSMFVVCYNNILQVMSSYYWSREA